MIYWSDCIVNVFSIYLQQVGQEVYRSTNLEMGVQNAVLHTDSVNKHAGNKESGYKV